MRVFEKMSYTIGMHGKALGFIFANKLGWFLLVPIALTVILMIGGVFSIGHFTSWTITYLENAINIKEWTPWLATLVSVLFIIVIKVVLFILFGFLSGYIVLILMSPFLAYISEKTEQIQTGKNYPFDIVQLISDALRGIIIAIRNSLLQLAIIVSVFIFSFFPVIGPIVTSTAGAIFLFLVSAYFYGFSFIDYTNERRRMKVSQSVQFVRQHKGVAMGSGFFFALLLFIPFIGPFLASIFSVISTVAATMVVLEIEEN